MLVRIINYSPELNGKYAKLINKNGPQRLVECGDTQVELLETEIEPITYDVVNWEEFIFNSERDFLKKFAHKANDLIGVWFSSESVKINYLLECGQTISDSVDILEFLDWMKKSALQQLSDFSEEIGDWENKLEQDVHDRTT